MIVAKARATALRLEAVRIIPVEGFAPIVLAVCLARFVMIVAVVSDHPSKDRSDPCMGSVAREAMKIMKRRKKFGLYTSTALLLSAMAGEAMSQDGFIRQPSIQTQPREKSTTQPKPNKHAEPVQAVAQTYAPSFVPPGTDPVTQQQKLQQELQWLKRDESVPSGHYGRPPVEPVQHAAQGMRVETRPVAYPSPVEITIPSSAFPEPSTPSRPGDTMPTMQVQRGGSTPNAIQPMAAEQAQLAAEERQRIGRLGQLITANITASKTTQPVTAVQPLSAPPGWQSVRDRLQAHLNRCEQLLRRNAFYSGREEAEQAMIYLTQILDGIRNEYSSTPAWSRAQQALREAEDFKNMQHLTSDSQLMKRLIESHQTPVLKSAIPSQLAPLIAGQHYREYALQQMMIAAKGHSWASEVFYALGRAHQAEADDEANAERLREAELARWQSVVYYKAAVQARPSNALAANQLGFILLGMDQPQEAYRYLDLSLQTETSPAALSNMVEACKRLGNSARLRDAAEQLQNFEGRASQVPTKNHIMVVDPQDFKQWSPYTASPGVRR